MTAPKPDLKVVGGTDREAKRHKPGTFALVSLHVLDGPRLTWSEVQVWLTVSGHASIQTGNMAHPTQETIARKTGLHRKTVWRALHGTTERPGLLERGILAIESKKRVKGQWASLTYRVAFPADEDS